MNRITELLEIKYPIIQGGMGNISNSILAAAVSNAGGLGTIGGGTMEPEEVGNIVAETKKLTKKPFAMNIPINVTAYLMELVGLAIDYKIPVVSLSAGNPEKIIPVLKKNNIKIISVVGSVKQAVKAEKLGADAIVAEGYEAAGINSLHETSTLALIPQVADSVSIPVIAAGGIADGRGMAAVLALGASGVQLGTRLIATRDAPFHDVYKQKIIEANDHATVIVGRAAGKIRRLLKTPYSERLLSIDKNGTISVEEYEKLTDESRHRKGALEGDLDEGFINGGQAAGLISDLPSVSDLFEKMMGDSLDILEKAYKNIEMLKREH